MAETAAAARQSSRSMSASARRRMYCDMSDDGNMSGDYSLVLINSTAGYSESSDGGNESEEMASGGLTVVPPPVQGQEQVQLQGQEQGNGKMKAAAVQGQDGVPGAHSVTGLDLDNLESGRGARAAAGGAIAAELVDTVAEEQEREEERDRIRQETIANIQTTAPKAEIYDDTKERQQRQRTTRMLVFALVVAVLVAVVVGVVLGTRDPPPPELTVEDYVRLQFGDSPLLSQEGSPQNLSINWLNNTDMYLTYPLANETELAKFRQRYIICILAFGWLAPGWKRVDGWGNPETSDCEWKGLTCDSRGEIVGINLGDNNLNGTFPTELGALSFLETLFLNDNPLLRGTLPTEIANMRSMKVFYGNGNGFEGALPENLGKLSAVETLNLADNQINGTIPVQYARGMLSLRDLDLSGNNISGPIPEEVYRWQRMRNLQLHDNDMTGMVLSELGLLMELETLELQNNNINGTIPNELGNLINLRVLDVSGTSVNGSMPESICDLRSVNDEEADGLQVLNADCDMDCSCCTNSCGGGGSLTDVFDGFN